MRCDLEGVSVGDDSQDIVGVLFTFNCLRKSKEGLVHRIDKVGAVMPELLPCFS